MKSSTTTQFRKCYSKLPPEARKQAKKSYSLFADNPYHPGLHFKRIHSFRPIFSIRISIDYRAAGVLKDSEIIWFWVGAHKDYELLIKQLRKT